jgi:hypothetical protein
MPKRREQRRQETPAHPAVREKVEDLGDNLRGGIARFRDRLREEIEGAKPRVKDNVKSAMDREQWRPLGRPPAGRPPSRRPPSGRPPSHARRS